MKFINRDDNALTLTNDSSGKMVFVYKSRKHAVLFGIFAIALSYAVWHFSNEIKNVHIYIYWFSCFLAGALCFGTITTLWTNCRLEVDASRKTVSYSLSTLFGKTEWKRNFDDFNEIRIYRPIASSGNAGHAAFLKVLLITAKGEEIPLGTGMLGINNKQKATKFADKMSKIMSLSVRAIVKSGVQPDQAASLLVSVSSSFTSIPSLNLTPSMTLAK